MKEKKYYLNHGSDWAEHEDFLVGNKEGLLKLQNQIDEAIENGESNEDIGDFIGIRCLENEVFEKNDNVNSRLSNILAGLIMLCFVGVFISGLIYIFKMIF